MDDLNLNAINFWAALERLALVVGWGAAIWGGISAWSAKRRAKVAEKKLEVAFSRSEGPRFEVAAAYLLDGGRFVQIDFMNPVVDGAIVKLQLRNIGASIYEMMDDQPSGLGFHLDPNYVESGGEVEFSYKCEGAQSGNKQKVKLEFEGGSGFKHTHTYEFVQGGSSFKRIDPD